MSLGHYEHLGTYRNILGTLRKSIEVICIKTKFNLKKKINHNNENAGNIHIFTNGSIKIGLHQPGIYLR